MFAILVTSLFEDCQPNFVLNWVTANVYYGGSFNQSQLFQVFSEAGITDPDTQNKMWFDQQYGFKTFNGYINWVKMGYFKYSPDHKLSNLAQHLITYFHITTENMVALVSSNTSWIYTHTAAARRISLFSHRIPQRRTRKNYPLYQP